MSGRISASWHVKVLRASGGLARLETFSGDDPEHNSFMPRSASGAGLSSRPFRTPRQRDQEMAGGKRRGPPEAPRALPRARVGAVLALLTREVFGAPCCHSGRFWGALLPHRGHALRPQCGGWTCPQLCWSCGQPLRVLRRLAHQAVGTALSAARRSAPRAGKGAAGPTNLDACYRGRPHDHPGEGGSRSLILGGNSLDRRSVLAHGIPKWNELLGGTSSH